MCVDHQSVETAIIELHKLKAAVEQSPVATLIADTHGIIEFVSLGYTQQTGFSAQEMLGRPLDQFEPEYAHACANQELMAKIGAGGIWRGTLQSRRKNGTFYWETQTFSGILDAQGCLIQLLLSKENVSQRKRAEGRLRRSEAFSTAIMESMTDAIVVIDTKAGIVAVNQAWRRFTSESGQCPNSAAMHTGIDGNFYALCEGAVFFTHASDAEAIRLGIQAVLNGQLSNFNLDYQCKAKTHPLWFSLTVTPLAGGKSGAVLAHSNITERKQAELERSQYQDGLERKVGNSTKQLGTLALELMKTETRERRSIAEDLHDDLGQHLTVLKLKLTSLVVPGQSPESQRLLQDLKAIEEIVDRSAESVRSISSHLSPPVLHREGINQAMHWLAEEMQRTYGLRVNLSLDKDMRSNETINGSVYRTVRELLINVWKHANVSAADVSIHFDELHEEVDIKVTDTGSGFDIGEVQKPSSKLSFGIYSIRERMHLIGGTLHIDSSPGCGTVVRIRIPVPTLSMDGKQLA